MRRDWVVGGCAWLLVAGLPLGAALAQTPAPESVATGGLLYDKWWKAVPGAKAPVGDHPVWASQTTNKLKGEATWRCKECHGWDYRGKDGAYGSGSHATGFPGVIAAGGKSLDELKAILKGSADRRHDFSSVLNDTALTHLATFLKHGPVDLKPLIDPKTKKAVKADADAGKKSFEACAACHGADGATRNFGKPDKPEYVGTVARANPWEFLHKVRFGHPGSDPPMPSGVELGLSLHDVLDLLAYSQTLRDK